MTMWTMKNREFLTPITVLLILGVNVALAPTFTELFFSEYVEGSAYNKALEIFNGTSAAVDLAAGGYNVAIFFNGSTTPGATISLTGSVPAYGVYVLAHSSANPTLLLPKANQTSGSLNFNGDDAVALRKYGTLIDVIGQIGVDPGLEWGTDTTTTKDHTLRRKFSIIAGDPNGSDPFDPAGEWDGFPVDTFDGLGHHLPWLSVRATTTNTVVISWPIAGAEGWVLEATNALPTVSAPWPVIPPPYQTNGVNLQVIEPAPLGNKFYRLHRP